MISVFSISYIFAIIAFAVFLGKFAMGRKPVMVLHVLTLALLVLNYSASEFLFYSLHIILREWIALIFLTSGAFVFALYAKSLSAILKIYFGLYFFPPALAGLSYMTDKILYLILAGPLMVAFPWRDTYPLTYGLEIRTYHQVTSIGYSVIIKKGLLLEKKVAFYDNEISPADYSSLTINDITLEKYRIAAKDSMSGEVEYLDFIRNH